MSDPALEILPARIQEALRRGQGEPNRHRGAPAGLKAQGPSPRDAERAGDAGQHEQRGEQQKRDLASVQNLQ